MAIKLITGTSSEQNVKSEDDGARLYGTISTSDCVLNVGEKFGYEIISNNSVRIKSGEALIQGRHARQAPGTYTDVTIDNGTQSQKRNDIIVLRYTKDNRTDLENVELAVKKGTPGASATDPTLTTGNVYSGCLLHEMALYRVCLNGLNVTSVTQLFKTVDTVENVANSIKSMATILNFVYPVGSIYLSVSGVNPATLFGGTWTRWGSGRVPVGVNSSDSSFSTVEKTGGSKTHTLTVEEMPNHSHSCISPLGIRVSDSGTDWNIRGNDVTTSWSTNSTGGGKSHNNLPPYITCYMWKRTA